MQYSIRHRLTITFVALAVLPLLLVGVILVWQSFTVQQQQAITLQNELALRVSGEVAAFIEQIEKELRLTSQLQALPKLTYEEQQSFLFKLQSSLDVIEGLTLLNNEGQELARVSRVEIVTADDLTSRAETDRFVKSQNSQETYYSAVRFDEATVEPLITMGIALVDVQRGESNGVLVADIRLKRIWELMASIEVNTGEQVYIVDGEGKVIAHRNPSVVLRGTSFDVPEEDGIKQGLDNNSVVLAVESLEFGEQRFAIVTERSLSEAFALAINTLLIMLGVIVLTLLGASALGVLVVRQILQPIETLAVAAQAIKAGDLSQQVDISSKDEIGLLGQAFNAMAAENVRLFEQTEEALEMTRLRLKVNEAFIGLQCEQDVLDTIMEQASFHKDARVMLLLLESEGEDKKFVLRDGQSLESGLPTLPIGLSFPFKAYPLSQYTTTQALFVTNNILTDERIDEASRSVMKRTGTMSLLTAQLAVGKQLYGLLSVGSKEPDYFDEHKRRLHQILAERGGLALHEARLRAATEEARAEAEHERNLLNSILSTLPVGVYVSDKQGKAIRTNQMAQTLLGHKIIESPEKELPEIYHVVYSESELSYPQEKLPLVKTLTDGLPYSCDDMAVIQPDGTKIDLLVNSGALVDQNGEKIGATVAFSDVSQRRRVEEALRESEQRFRTIFNEGPIGMLLLTEEGQIVQTNRALCDMLGYNEEVLLNKHFKDITYSDDIEIGREQLLQLERGEIDQFQLEKRYLDKKGEAVWGLLSVAAVRDDEKAQGYSYSIAHIQNITERKRTEEALARANQELRGARDELELRVEARTAELGQLNQELENLLYIISHDLKEPLRAIQNFSRLVIRRYAKKLDAKGQDYLARVDRAGARLRTLIDDILTLSRAQRMELRLEPIASEKMVEDILERLETQIQESQASIEVAKDLPHLKINRTWGTQAIYNLISNGLKYRRICETSGKALPPELLISRYEGREGIGLVVKDRGPGVPKEYAERIFQLFQRAVGREIEGTGAGLTIVRQIAQRHGGHAWVEAREGGGSEFIITFGKRITDNAAQTQLAKFA